ncbi:MAG: trypsin-like peptidase domain-containing protein [Chloroflexota bacterium]|nr:trypsin-like peptidase domain-containing protein [Chloroflexota bacterium]
MQTRRPYSPATLAASITLIASMVMAMLITAPSTAAQDAPSTPVEQRSAADVVEQVAPAVVTVYNIDVLQGIGQQQEVRQGAGTGFIIDEEGHIVTNWHVVTGGDQYAVELFDGTLVEAELIGEDPRDDLAVVKIDPASVPAVVGFGDSDALRPGETVLAIGSPLGDFQNTVTQGIIGGLGRDTFGQQSQSNFCQTYSNLIQHDAAINPGNSGGPLFNLEGEVIGVNTLGLPVGPDGTPLQGLFFAVPSETVITAAEQLIANGQISAPYIGITSEEINPAEAEANDLPVDSGNYVIEVSPSSPADEAGLQEGDIITAIGGTQITPEQPLGGIIIEEYLPGDQVQFDITRNGDEQTIDLTIGEAPAELFDECVLETG